MAEVKGRLESRATEWEKASRATEVQRGARGRVEGASRSLPHHNDEQLVEIGWQDAQLVGQAQQHEGELAALQRERSS